MLSQQQKLLVEGQTTANEAWTYLRTIYEPITLARVSGLKQDFENLKMEENKSMAVLLSRVDKAALALVDVHRVLPDEDVGFRMLTESQRSLKAWYRVFIVLRKPTSHRNLSGKP